MSDLHRIEITLDEHCYQAVLAEAARLHVEVEQLVERATAAWITEIAENTSTCTASVTVS